MAAFCRLCFGGFVARVGRLSAELTPVDLLVREQIRTRGPMGYAEVVDLALYHPEHGFYSGSGRAGRRGDFITSAEVGPLFGHVVANAIDAEWFRLGQPESFTVIDAGAGPGTLARSVLSAQPQCSPALRYVAVEQSASQRVDHPEGVVSVEELSANSVGDGFDGVILANELLDNLAFSRVERVGAAMCPLDVTLSDRGDLELVAASSSRELDSLFAAEVTTAVFQPLAAQWVLHARSVLTRGRVIVIDYARLGSAEVEIRTYAEHERAGDPLVALGTKDITVDVDLEQLQRVVGPADRICSQAEWLAGHGIGELVEEGKRRWEQSAGIGDLSALKFRSRINEAGALTAQDGLGGFLVAEWVVG